MGKELYASESTGEESSKREATEDRVKRTYKAFMEGDMKTAKSAAPDGILVIEPEDFDMPFTFSPDTMDPSEYEVLK